MKKSVLTVDFPKLKSDTNNEKIMNKLSIFEIVACVLPQKQKTDPVYFFVIVELEFVLCLSFKFLQCTFQNYLARH